MNKSNFKIFNYGNYSYQYNVLYQDRKTIALTVKPDKGIILKCPYAIDEQYINNFLKRKWLWLNTQLDFFERTSKKKYKREYVSGETFLYLGKQYKLIVKKSTMCSLKLSRGVFLLQTNKSVRDSKQNKKIIDQWFKNKAQEVFSERFIEVKKRFDYQAMPNLEIRNMPKRWGSFVSKKKIILNPKLIHASKDCIDYVITHELCHMKFNNHSKLYWNFLNQKYPNWDKVKEKLEVRYGFN